MPFFKKLKQKIAQQKITRFQEKSLVIFSLVFLFAFFTPHIVSATSITPAGWGEDIVGFILRTVLKLCAILLSLAETLFAWIIVPENMTAVIDNEIIYATWRVVRDFFNIAFILVLLFSAFATIFQASSNYNYKKVLLNLVIMALLVNFSYPIARFLIDVSNVIMYGILNGLGGSNSFMEIIRLSGLAKIFDSTKNADLSYLLMLVIFTFIFAITLLVIAVLLVIRTITLALYVIFSPIAFIGSILPGTDLASASSDWWKDFIKQCFAGPTIVLMLFISTKMVNAITLAGGKIEAIATVQASTSAPFVSNFITTCSFFALPIIILWYGIILAQKSDIAGAKEVVGYGTKAIKWVGKNPAFGTMGFISKQSGMTGAVKERWSQFTKEGPLFGSDKREAREAFWSKKLGVKHADDKLNAKKIKSAKEDNAMETMAVSRLKNIAETGNKYEKAAAMEVLASQHGHLEKSYLEQLRKDFGQGSQTFQNSVSKAKALRPDLAFAKYTDNGEIKLDQDGEIEFDEDLMESYMDSNEFSIKNLSGTTLAHSKFMKKAFDKNVISVKDLEEMRGKSFGHERNIANSLGKIAGNYSNLQALEGEKDQAKIALTSAEEALATAQVNNRPAEEIRSLKENIERLAETVNTKDSALRIARNVQIAHVAQTGKFHNSVYNSAVDLSDPNNQDKVNAIKQITGRLNKDTGKRLDAETLSSDEMKKVVASGMGPRKYKEIIQAMEDKKAQLDFNTYMQNTEHATGDSNLQSIHKIATTDNNIKNFTTR